jgi:hypothetical protein
MVKLEHSLKFVTEVDETHPSGMQLLALQKEMQTIMLEGALRNLIVPALKETLDEFNAGGSWAILKVAE